MRKRELIGTELWRPATVKKEQIDGRIDQKHYATQTPLNLARERGWIKDWHEIVLDETSPVDRPSSFLAKPVLEV